MMNTRGSCIANLGNFRDLKYSDYDRILFLSACGYEERCIDFFSKTYEILSRYMPEYRIFSFSTFKDCLHRKSNEAYLSRYRISPTCTSPKDSKTILGSLKEFIDSHKGDRLLIIIDYSSMPRNWYCNLFSFALKNNFNNVHFTFWYTMGDYQGEEYPCVGYGEFEPFSGRPNLTQTREICIYGLGFDSIRSYGIWNFMDPQSTVCILSATSNNEEYLEKSRQENREILSSSEKIFELRIDLMHDLISYLCDISRKYLQHGDVALIPDGPKPLVMAMSVVPILLGYRGIYCWHVGHVKPYNYSPIDVLSTGEYFGFEVKSLNR